MPSMAARVGAARPAPIAAAIDEAFSSAAGVAPHAPRRRLTAPAYVVWADAWDADAGRPRAVPLLDACDVACELTRTRGASVRVLDLGCGDGAFLAHVHAHVGINWSHLVGVAAEDERAQSASGEPCVPDGSFALANVETLTLERLAAALGDGASEPAPFDLVVSFSTWWHLLDPLGSACAVHDALLAPGGVLLLHGVPLSHLPPPSRADEADDLATAARLQATLRAEGEDVTLVVQHETAQPAWIRRLCVTWLQRKRERTAGVLRLPFAYAGGVHALHGAHRAAYARAPLDAAGTDTGAGAPASAPPAPTEPLLTTAYTGIAGSSGDDARRRDRVRAALERCCAAESLASPSPAEPAP